MDSVGRYTGTNCALNRLLLTLGSKEGGKKHDPALPDCNSVPSDIERVVVAAYENYSAELFAYAIHHSWRGWRARMRCRSPFTIFRGVKLRPPC